MFKLTGFGCAARLDERMLSMITPTDLIRTTGVPSIEISYMVRSCDDQFSALSIPDEKWFVPCKVSALLRKSRAVEVCSEDGAKVE